MSESLLGVILATSSTRGSHIVFRWPNNPKLFKRYSKVKYFTDSQPRQQHHSHHHHEDELDPVRQKARWDRNDEDHDDHHSEDARQSDTPSSSDVEESDASGAEDDQGRSVSGSETAASHSRSKAAASANRSKSKVRRPLVAGLEESNNSVRSGDRVKDAGEAHDRAPDSDTGTTKELSPEEKARREEKAARAYKTYLGYDVEILASILNPRLELAHQKFELVVDDVAFLGHPVAVSKTGTWGEPDDNGRDGNGDGDEGNERDAGQGQQRGRSGLRKEIRPYDVPDGQDSPKDSSPASSKPSRSVSQSRTESTTGSSNSKSTAPLTQFHLVLVLDRPDPSTTIPNMDLSSWLQLYYDNIVFKMTAALFAEQSKADYVGRETEKLLSLRERCMDDGQAYAAYAAQCLGISSLARCIRDLHKSISTSSDALITINDRIEVHLQLPPILQDPTNLTKTVDIETELDPNDPIFLSGGGFAGLGKEGADEDGGGGTYDRLLDLAPHQLSFEEWCRTTGPYLLPWKTLLLLHDQAEEPHTRGKLASGNASPAGNASPGGGQAHEAHGFEQLARNFTALFRPNLYHSLNFSQVADMLGWDLYEDVYPMIRHLIYYRQARVIDIPRPGHVYAISPLFDFARLPQLSRIWAHTFPDLVPLPVFLSQLSSSGRPMNARFPARHQRELALNVLIWLLRRDVVVKMHIRLRLMATEAVKRRTAERRQERHDRHRRRKEKKRERLAKMEARRIKKSQMEEQKRRTELELAERKEKEEAEMANEGEKRGRSRERDRSRSADTRKKGETVGNEEQEGSRDATVDEAEQRSGLSRLGLKALADTDDLDEVAAAAAAIAGSDAGSSVPGHHRHHHHHHHKHHHHHRHHHHKHRKGSNTSDSDRSPHPISIKPPFDELKFERRPVLRSRSPSTAHTSVPALSVSFSNPADRPAFSGRPRADTTSSSNSSNHPHSKVGLSMTPSTSQMNSRPTTPNVVPGARMIPSHVRDRSIGGGSNVSSSAEGSVPRRTRRATSAAGSASKAIGRSRSPSRARMRVRGFGVGAEVEIDEEKSGEEGEDEGGDGEMMEALQDDDLSSKLDALKLNTGSKIGKGERQTTRRRISTASERPDLPPPSESGGEGEANHSDACTCSKCSTHTSASSSSGSFSTSDFSLSSSQSSGSDSDAELDSASSADGHRPPMHRSGTLNTNADEDFSESLIVEPSRASRRENEYIATMVADKDPATVKKFFRLLPYLNGKHTIDEIEYRVKMRRRDIRRLLSVFRDAVITFMHP